MQQLTVLMKTIKLESMHNTETTEVKVSWQCHECGSKNILKRYVAWGNPNEGPIRDIVEFEAETDQPDWCYDCKDESYVILAV